MFNSILPDLLRPFYRRRLISTYILVTRPAYQGELTALETEIEQLWDQYVLRYRCVEALKHQLSVLESAQAEVGT